MAQNRHQEIGFAGLLWTADPAECAGHLARKGFLIGATPEPFEGGAYTTGAGRLFERKAELFLTFVDGVVDSVSVSLSCPDSEDAEFLWDDILTGLVNKYGRPETEDGGHHWFGEGGLAAGIDEDEPDEVGLIYLSPRRVDALRASVAEGRSRLQEDIDALL